MKILRPYFILIIISIPTSYILSVNQALSIPYAQELGPDQVELNLQILLKRIEKHRITIARNPPSKLQLALAIAQKSLEMGKELARMMQESEIFQLS